MTETADIARAAARLRGNVDTIAAELVEHIEGAPRYPADDATPSERLAYHQAMADHRLAVNARRHWLTLEFARRHGWMFKRGDHFTHGMLAEGRKRHGRRDHAWAGRGWADHSHYFRTPDGCPAAVVACPYVGAYSVGSLAVARECRIVVTCPTDFPSWWYPGRTELVLFTPADAGAARGMAA